MKHSLSLLIVLVLVALAFNLSSCQPATPNGGNGDPNTVMDSLSPEYLTARIAQLESELSTAAIKSKHRGSIVFDPVAITENTLLYSQRNLKSAILDTLDFGQQLQIKLQSDNETPGQGSPTLFHEAISPDGKICFIRDIDISFYRMTLGDGRHLRFGEDASIPDSAYTRLISCLAGANKPQEEVRIPLWFGFDGIETVNSLALKNLSSLIVLSSFHGSPSATRRQFVADIDGHFSAFLQSYHTGEEDAFEERRIYLPVKFRNGRILLVENGNVDKIFDDWNTSLRTLEYPLSVGIPIEELVVVVNEEAQYVLDEKGAYTFDPQGKAYTKLIQQSTEYYRWDGNRLLRKGQ